MEECLQNYGGLVWSLARKPYRNHADAEDAVQEAFIAIWRYADRFDPSIASEATYITMIARRRFIDRLRKRRREIESGSIQEELVDSTSKHEEQTELQEEAAQARQYVRQLRPEQQQVLELSITHGLSQNQISEATNLPLGTVKTHTRRGLMRLRELLGADQVASVTEDAV